MGVVPSSKDKSIRLITLKQHDPPLLLAGPRYSEWQSCNNHSQSERRVGAPHLSKHNPNLFACPHQGAWCHSKHPQCSAISRNRGMKKSTGQMSIMQKWAVDCWEYVKLVTVIIKPLFRQPIRIISHLVPAQTETCISHSAHFININPNSSPVLH